jgi:preprotein translocase subunit SecE
MARNRQRAKQRQAERRARRLAEREDAPPAGEPDATSPVEARRTAEPAVDDPRAAPPGPGLEPELAVGAPPTDLGRSDEVIEDEPELLESDDGAAAEAAAEEEAIEYAPRGRRGEEAAPAKRRSRVVQFLIAVWAELQRVQWPDRQALTTLTGVVLGFVLIAGGYLGLLDAIFSRIIEAIL